MKTHLLKYHAAASRHHHKLAKLHSETASALLSAHEDLPRGHPLKKTIKALAHHHEVKAGLHSEHSDRHLALCKSLGETARSVAELPDTSVEELGELGGDEGAGAGLARLHKLLS